MYKRKNKSRLNKKWSNLKKKGWGAIESGLGFVPGLGTALNIRNTTRKTIRAARAGKEYSNALGDEIRKRLRG